MVSISFCYNKPSHMCALVSALNMFCEKRRRKKKKKKKMIRPELFSPARFRNTEISKNLKKSPFFIYLFVKKMLSF